MLDRTVDAINKITTQVWAFLILVTGVISIVIFHRNGIDVGIGAGITGAGINMFQSSTKSISTVTLPVGANSGKESGKESLLSGTSGTTTTTSTTGV